MYQGEGSLWGNSVLTPKPAPQKTGSAGEPRLSWEDTRQSREVPEERGESPRQRQKNTVQYLRTPQSRGNLELTR